MPSKAFSVDLQAITQRRQVDQHIEQISQRVGAAGSLALGFSLHQLQTLAASASDVAVVVQAIHDDIRAMRLAESDATAFPAASVHFIQRDIALLHRTKLPAVLLRLAHDEQLRAADLSQVVQANSGGTLIFAASSSLRGLDMVKKFMQLEKVADALIPAGSGCIAAGQQLAGSQVES